jgi:hypothetical protein
MNRLINIEFVSLLAVLFLAGLKWINLNYNVPTTAVLVTDNTLESNPILAYFIITFVIFVIALVQFSTTHPTQSSATRSRPGIRCPLRTSSIFAPFAMSPSSSSTRPSTATTYMA